LKRQGKELFLLNLSTKRRDDMRALDAFLYGD
jgi:hypothetical protein